MARKTHRRPDALSRSSDATALTIVGLEGRPDAPPHGIETLEDFRGSLRPVGRSFLKQVRDECGERRTKVRP